MPAQIGCWPGQHDEVADPWFDHLVATGAEVAFQRLIRLNSGDFEFFGGKQLEGI